MPRPPPVPPVPTDLARVRFDFHLRFARASDTFQNPNGTDFPPTPLVQSASLELEAFGARWSKMLGETIAAGLPPEVKLALEQGTRISIDLVQPKKPGQEAGVRAARIQITVPQVCCQHHAFLPEDLGKVACGRLNDTLLELMLERLQQNRCAQGRRYFRVGRAEQLLLAVLPELLRLRRARGPKASTTSTSDPSQPARVAAEPETSIMNPENPADPFITDTPTIREVLGQITFSQSCLDMGWGWEVREVEVREIGGADGAGPMLGWLISTTFQRPDRDSGALSRGRGREWWVPNGATLSSVVKTAWSAAEFIVKHELMEAFKFQGARPFDPHATIAELTGIGRGAK